MHCNLTNYGKYNNKDIKNYFKQTHNKHNYSKYVYSGVTVKRIYIFYTNKHLSLICLPDMMWTSFTQHKWITATLGIEHKIDNELYYIPYTHRWKLVDWLSFIPTVLCRTLNTDCLQISVIVCRWKLTYQEIS